MSSETKVAAGAVVATAVVVVAGAVVAVSVEAVVSVGVVELWLDAGEHAPKLMSNPSAAVPITVRNIPTPFELVRLAEDVITLPVKKFRRPAL